MLRAALFVLLPALMELTDEHKSRIAAWIDEGLKLSDIQRRLADEHDVHLTYMDVRFLVDDLKLTPHDPVPPEIVAGLIGSAQAAASATTGPVAEPSADVLPPAGTGAGKVAVKVDEIMRPGALVSGSVTFSDGKKSAWHLDQMGRLGMVPEEPGYRPPQSDIAEFQVALEKELVKLGM